MLMIFASLAGSFISNQAWGAQESKHHLKWWSVVRHRGTHSSDTAAHIVQKKKKKVQPGFQLATFYILLHLNVAQCSVTDMISPALLVCKMQPSAFTEVKDNNNNLH